MQFFFQLNLDKIPKPLHSEFGGGLLQLFYCTNSRSECEIECRAEMPFADSELVRIVHPNDKSSGLKIPKTMHSFPPKEIIRWEEIDDLPAYEDAERIGIQMSEPEWDELLCHVFPRYCDKLAGLPFGIPIDEEFADCPICGEMMQLIFQLDSDENLPCKYADYDFGTGYITQCKTHKEVVAFSWEAARLPDDD